MSAKRPGLHPLQERMRVLRQHARALRRANLRLESEIRRRQRGERVILRAQQRYRTLLLESQVTQKKCRQLTHQILTAQEEERKAISRELHDQVVQTLVGINVQLAALGQDASAQRNSFQRKITRTRRLVESSVSAVHRFARDLRPSVLDDLGLIPALHAFCRRTAAENLLRIDLTAFAGVEQLPIAKRTVLYRVAQEALTNVVRHARALRVRVRITETARFVRLEVADDGRAFVVEKALGTAHHRRLGLIGMKERIEMLGGRFSIVSKPGTGTQVIADIPFRPKPPKS